MRGKRLGPGLAMGLFGIASAIAGACSDSTQEKLALASLADGCVINTDCESPLVCAFRKCHSECTTSRDCEEGQRCVASDRPFRVCQLEEERVCIRNSECPAPMVCGVDGECRDQCASDRDCVAEQQCIGGTCAEPAELDADGNLPVSPDAVPDLDTGGKPCLYTSECTGGLVCRSGLCVVECRTDVDCPIGARCDAGEVHRCVTAAPTNDGGGCVYNSDCQSGQFCVGGACRCQCRRDVDCGLSASCDGCACSVETGGTGGNGSGGTGAAGGASGGAGGTVAAAASGGTLDASPGCTYNSECGGGGQVCAQGRCRCQCRETVDCAAGQICNGCACVNDAPVGAPPGYGSSCNLKSDCVAPLVCQNGRCGYECNVDTDCGTQAGICCFQNRCVTGSVCLPGGPDAGSGGAGGSGGCQACVSNFDCADGVWCNGIERCFAGCCAPALDTPCNSNSSCIVDICDEANQSCGQVVVAGEDVDGDGHLAFGCDNGDDCDDSDPEVYTGAQEMCDGKDNDCNGYIDDRSRRAYGPTLMVSDTRGTALAAPVAGGWGVVSRRLNCCPQDFMAALKTDEQGAITQNWNSLFGVPGDGLHAIFDVSAGGGTVVGVWKSVNSAQTSQSQNAFLVNDSMADPEIAQVPLSGAAAPSLFGDADSTWTGSQYFIGWVGDGAATTGNVGTLSTSGSLNGAPVPTGAPGAVVAPTRIRVSSNAATRGALYQLPDDRLAVAVFSPSLSTLAGPVILPADSAQRPVVIAIGGSVGGHIAVWADDVSGTRATFVSDAGALGKSVDVLGTRPVDGDGGTDGDGAMFSFDYNGRASFGYARGALDSPFEVSNAISTGGTAPSFSNVATDGERYGLSVFMSNTVRWVGVGCQPALGDGGS